MKKTQTPLLPLLLVLLAAAVSFSAAHDHHAPVRPRSKGCPNKDLVRICSVTSYQELCISTTQPFVPRNGTVDQNLVIRLELNALRSRIKDILAELDKFLAQPPTVPPVADDTNSQKRYVSGLSDCREFISGTATIGLDQASDEFQAGNSYMFKQRLDDVTGAGTDCEMSFDGVPTKFWPQSDIQDIYQLADNCMAIINDVTPEYEELPGGGRKRL